MSTLNGDNDDCGRNWPCFWCVQVQKVAMLADINLHTSIRKRLSLWDPKGLVIRCRRAATMLHGLYPYPQWISVRRTVCSIVKQQQRHAADTLLLGATRYIDATVLCSGSGLTIPLERLSTVEHRHRPQRVEISRCHHLWSQGNLQDGTTAESVPTINSYLLSTKKYAS
jgi:hypothetical protein